MESLLCPRTVQPWAEPAEGGQVHLISRWRWGHPLFSVCVTPVLESHVKWSEIRYVPFLGMLHYSRRPPAWTWIEDIAAPWFHSSLSNSCGWTFNKWVGSTINMISNLRYHEYWWIAWSFMSMTSQLHQCVIYPEPSYNRFITPWYDATERQIQWPKRAGSMSCLMLRPQRRMRP